MGDLASSAGTHQGGGSVSARVYLDFDGVIASLDPGDEQRLTIDGTSIPLHRALWLRAKVCEPDTEVIWVSHREEEVHFYADHIIPGRLPNLKFTDPTGSKVKDIISHYQANPCEQAFVCEDSLTSAEIEALNQAGITVVEYENTFATGMHPAGGGA